MSKTIFLVAHVSHRNISELSRLPGTPTCRLIKLYGHHTTPTDDEGAAAAAYYDEKHAASVEAPTSAVWNNFGNWRAWLLFFRYKTAASVIDKHPDKVVSVSDG